jgi:uncharacterized membrane protein
LTFTLTVVAIQLASQQFSPRLLREFARDPVTKRVLAVLTGTFVFAVTVMTTLDSEEALPRLALTIAYALVLASFASVLAFITHLMRELRVDTMMVNVHAESLAAMNAFYPPYGSSSDDGQSLGLDDRAGTQVVARSSGFVQRTDVRGLVTAAKRLDVVVRVEVRPGDHVVRGAPVATVWAQHGGSVAGEDAELAGDEVRAAIVLGYERTIDQDAAFGVRQLEDIAVKAMSPSINDPVTAAHATGHMADLLVRLLECRLGPTLHRDGEGVSRAIVPDRDLPYYLDLTCGQLRRFGSSEPTLLQALMRMLRDVANACRDDEQRKHVAEAAALVVDALDDDAAPYDREVVEDMMRRVQLALAGDRRGAYADRAGETRSM